MSDNVRSLSGAPSMEEQAQHWIARIDAGPLAPDQREALHAWLAEDQEHRRLLDSHALAWSAASLALRGQRQRKPWAAMSWWRQRWIGAAVLATMALVVGISIWGGRGPPAETASAPAVVMHSTRTGERLQVNLDDGSRVALNTATALQVSYDALRRRIVLDRGEGLFEVAKDAGRPFEVIAGRTLVRAVGTKFLVERSVTGRIDVTVIEGLVDVLRLRQDGTVDVGESARALRVGAGQTAVGEEDHLVVAALSPLLVERRMAWEQGRIVFDETPLAEALQQINRYATVPLRLADPALATVKVSGAFSTDDVQVFVRSLEQGFGLRSEAGGGAIVISRGPQR